MEACCSLLLHLGMQQIMDAVASEAKTPFLTPGMILFGGGISGFVSFLSDQNTNHIFLFGSLKAE